MRIGIASVIQETNTFSVSPTRLEDFSIAIGSDLIEKVEGTNSEPWGALDAIDRSGATAVPLLYAWAMPSGRVLDGAYRELRDLLTSQLRKAGPLDGLVLALHGSMASETHHDADGALLAAARELIGPDTPLAVSLDLHANVTMQMVDLADSISAYHTDPHVDMKEAGQRAAERAVLMAASQTRPSVGFAKRPIIVPAETMNTSTGIFADIRREALEEAPEGLLELCIFPVQPWLDVPELGLSVVATTTGDQAEANAFAESVASRIWQRREEFTVDRLMLPEHAIEAATRSITRPFLIAESADAPTAGASGDSPAMVAALLEFGTDLASYVPVVDPDAVAACHDAGAGSRLSLRVGASIDPRWWSPVELEGDVLRVGHGTYRLEGESFTGMEVSMGRYATVAVGSMRLLLSERAGWTSDPATFRFAGLPVDDADVIVVRSCSDFRANFPTSEGEAVVLDVPGTATPNLRHLEFQNMRPPPYPLARSQEI